MAGWIGPRRGALEAPDPRAPPSAFLRYPPRRMQAGDPAALAIFLGLLAGLPGASLARRGRRTLGASGSAAAGVALAAGVFELPGAAGPFAAAAGCAAALALPGLGLTRFRRRSFGGAFGRGGCAVSLAEARLPGRVTALRPSEIVDPAERLRVEAAIFEAERKSGAELALAIVRRAGTYEGASWRFAAWGAALALAASCAFAPGAPRVAALSAALAALAGRALAGVSRVGRFASSEAELAEKATQGAFDAFAHLGLARAPGRGGVLIFAALFEGRVIVLGDRGAPRPRRRGGDWSEVAAAAGAGLAGARKDALLGALEAAGALAARDLEGEPRPPPGDRPLPVLIED